MREHERELWDLFDQMEVFLFIIDFGGSIVDTNGTVRNRLGYTAEELASMHVTQVYPHERKKEAEENISSILRGERSGFSLPLIDRDGMLIPVETKVTRGRWHDREVLFATGRQTQSEITGLRDRTFELENHIKKMERKNAELERFLHTVSHDLKSPLITIKGFLTLLEQDSLNNDHKKMEMDILRINSGVERMHRILSELIELSRIDRSEGVSSEICLKELIMKALERFAGPLARRGVEVEMAENLPAVCGNRRRLSQVLENLLDNAIKFMGDQLHPRIEIGFDKQRDENVFYVRDNGMGIDPPYHDTIFDLFSKLDSGSEGTGIGLALVRRILEVHGGRVWLESAGRGHGSTVYFTLPLLKKHMWNFADGK